MPLISKCELIQEFIPALTAAGIQSLDLLSSARWNLIYTNLERIATPLGASYVFARDMRSGECLMPGFISVTASVCHRVSTRIHTNAVFTDAICRISYLRYYGICCSQAIRITDFTRAFPDCLRSTYSRTATQSVMRFVLHAFTFDLTR